MAQIAKVVSLTGKAYVVGADGQLRALKVGDQIQKGEIIRTAQDARVELMMADGQTVAVAPEANVRVDDAMVQADNRPAAQESAVQTATAETVIQALNRGGDLNQVIEPAAAGADGGGESGGDATFVRLLRIVEPVDPLAYNYTLSPLPTVQTITPAPLPENTSVLPVISVAVTPKALPAGSDGVVAVTPDVIQGSVSGMQVIEGSGGGSKVVNFLFTLDKISTTDITITYIVRPGSATMGGDINDSGSGTPVTITIPAGSNGFVVPVSISKDGSTEGNETFNIELLSANGATLGNTTATVTIFDDDISLKPVDAEVDETYSVEGVISAQPQSLGVDYKGSGKPPVVTLSHFDAEGNPDATWKAATRTLTDDNGYWKVVVNGDGTYTFTQLKVMTHPDGTNSNDALTVSITATVETSVEVNGVTTNSTATAPILITMLDDGPAITTANVAAIDTLTVDESALADNATASFADNFATAISYGADGAGTTAYTLVLTGTNVASGLYTLGAAGAQGNQIVLNQSGNTITGSYNGTDYFTISINTSTGVVTLDQLAAVYHASTASNDDTSTLTTAANALVVRATVTDADGDAVTHDLDVGAGGAFKIKDDGPAITTANVAAIDTLTVDESALADNATASFADNFATAISYGADGAGTTAYTLVLTGTNVASGLYTLGAAGAQGNQIVLNQSGNTITGSYNGTDYFTISINTSTGVVTLDQLAAVYHASTASNDDTSTLTTAANALVVRATVTDADGDAVTHDLDVGAGGAFKIKDDGPAITTANVAAIDTLTVDESALADNATASFADNFATAISYGADGAGTTAYTLVLTGTNVASGLYTLGAAGAQGNQIVLNQSGNTITGSYNGTDYFTISINTSTGVVTLDQLAAVYHASTASNDDTSTLTTAANALVVRATVTDADGDAVTHDLDVGAGGAFKIKDDGPAITTANVAAIDTLTVDESALADNATASFADNFATAISYGADGAGTTAYTLVLTGTNVASGLYTLGAAGAQGNQIVLNQSGNTITGSYNGTDYFTISINTSTGVVTLDQLAAVYHASTASNDDTSTLTTAANALVVRATVTDADGDAVTHDLDVGAGGAFKIKDDGPAITTANVAAIDTLTVDESALADNATASFADNFATAISYGADGAGTTAYTLVLTGTNVASGLYTLGAAGAQGNQIVLNQSGNTITGSYNGTDYFTISINTSTGVVTLDQLAAVYHASTASNDDTSTLTTAANALVVRATVTDADGDAVTHDLDVGAGGAFKIKDDGPAITTANVAAIDTLTVDESALADNATASFADNFATAISYGADGAGTTAYTLVLTGTNVASGLYTLGAAGAQGNQIVLNQSGNTITGSYNGTDYFTISINTSTGVVTLDQLAAVYHASTASNDDTSTLTTAANALVVRATVTDADGDAVTHDLDVGAGGAFKIKDDGPAITTANVAAIDTLTVDESALADNATASFADNFATAISYGADGAGTTAYTLVLTGTNVASGLYTLGAAGAQGNQIVLNQSGNTITGSYNGTDYFTISINTSTGVVTLDQLAAVYHASTASNDDTSTLTTAANALVVRATVTDADGDAVTHDLDVGAGGAFKIKDDGPAITTANVAAIDTLTVDESALADNATASFADNFATAISYGADGAGTTAYTLVLTGTNVASGLYTLGAAGAQGNQIVLNQSGNTITGSYNGTDYFTISINTSTGVVTLDQLAAVYHASTASNDDTSTLTTAANALVVRATVTDADGDAVTHDLDVGAGGAFKIKDDGPTFLSSNNVAELTSTTVGDTDSGSFGPSIGTDGLGRYSIQYVGDPTDLNFFEFGANDGSVILVATYSTLTNPTLSDALKSAYFRIDVNTDGTYTTTMLAAATSGLEENLLLTATYADYLVTLKDGTTINALNKTFDGNSGSGASSDKISVSNSGGGFAGFGIGNNTINTGEAIWVKFPAPTEASVLSFALEQTSGASGSASVTWTTYEADGKTEISHGSFVYNQGQTNGELITINPDENFSSIKITFDSVSGTYRLSDLRYATEVLPLDQELVFQVGITDGDGDTAYTDLTLDLSVDLNAPKTIVGGSSVDVIEGTASGDILIGGAGNDTLTGGLGADVFQWKLGDQGSTTTPAVDHITDFNVGQTDVLNIADLLQNESQATIGNYLKFGLEGGKLALLVDHDGSGAGNAFAATQKIVLDTYSTKGDLAVALSLSGTATDVEIINKMINDNLLKIST